MSKKNKDYEDKFKEQNVILYKSGKNLREISKEYDIPKMSKINKGHMLESFGRKNLDIAAAG